MGLFSSIRDKIFGHKKRDAGIGTGAGGAGAGGGAILGGGALGGGAQPQPQAQSQSPVGGAQGASAAATAQVDVGAVLSEMASAKGGGGNYKTSIVDLLKLLDLDSSLQARRELGEELGVQAGEHGSAEQNIALHKAVMAKLAANGGIVPDDLRN